LNECGFDVIDTLHFGRVPGLWANSMVWARKS
jgi:hypothetical protein